MPEPLKYMYDQKFITKLSHEMGKQYSKFESDRFNRLVFDSEWEGRELKARMIHIAKMLRDVLPHPYAEVLEIFKPVIKGTSGFEYMVFPEFVSLYGQDDYETSIAALEYFTTYASSEFAVRPFIVKYGEKMMQQMVLWAASPNHHVRRLASEGCRPRLPWAMALPVFKKNPAPVIEVLTRLKNDDSEYVRRSVANNLNDIAKDHPALVVKLAAQWIGDNRETDWLVRHACRTLLKRGDPEVLSLFGFPKPTHIQVSHFNVQENTRVGESLAFEVTLRSEDKPLGAIRVEYGIDFVKKNGSLSRKVFKLSELTHKSNEKVMSKVHSFREISTRVYHPGDHRLAIICNGIEMACLPFQLLAKE